MFKKPLKSWFRNVIVLYIFSQTYSGFEILSGNLSLLWAGLVQYFIQILLHPLLKVLFIPINVITLGMFRWLLTAIQLVIIAYALDVVRFTPFSYQGFNLLGIPIPGGHINLLFSIIIGSIYYRFLRKVLGFLF